MLINRLATRCIPKLPINEAKQLNYIEIYIIKVMFVNIMIFDLLNLYIHMVVGRSAVFAKAKYSVDYSGKTRKIGRPHGETCKENVLQEGKEGKENERISHE
uniref:Uncharacterized protein n=1 Tax=Onchocerca volvulus TaxID=6282 RepID=A0A8R1TSS9_ONCVO